MDIKVKIVPNPLYGRPGSLVQSRYVGQVVHTGTVTADDVCRACKESNPQMTEPLASLATETIMDYGSDKVVADVVRFNLGSDFFAMEPAVGGSVPTVDAALTDENERYIKVVNGAALNARIAKLRPVIVTGDLGDVQFHSTETAHGDREWKNTLFAGEEFVALGKRLGGAEQTMQLVAADGSVLSDATFIAGDALGQRFRYKLATPPAESGACKLVLTSTGKDTPDANPKSIPVPVEYVAPAPAPTVTLGPVRCGGSEGVINLAASEFTVDGEHLEKLDGDTLKIKGVGTDGSAKEYASPNFWYDDNDTLKLRVPVDEALRTALNDDWDWDSVTVEYTSRAGAEGSVPQVTTCSARVINDV